MSAESISDIRKRAWTTRRAKYGPQGHGGSYRRLHLNRDAMLALIIRLHNEAVLSEGQVARATGLDRLTIRKLEDEGRTAA